MSEWNQEQRINFIKALVETQNVEQIGKFLAYARRQIKRR
jgi:hypothetical protein